MKKFTGIMPMADAPKERKPPISRGKGAGRKVAVIDGIRIGVYLGREHYDRAMAIGNGNLSHGIRIALSLYRIKVD